MKKRFTEEQIIGFCGKSMVACLLKTYAVAMVFPKQVITFWTSPDFLDSFQAPICSCSNCIGLN